LTTLTPALASGGRKMRSREEVKKMAVFLKVSMIDRSQRIEQMSSTVGKKLSAVAGDVSDDRFKTMQIELKDAVSKQHAEGVMYATLRWALGIKDDIDASDLDLDV